MSIEDNKTMGTWPVFMTAISTILGAILYLRFGYAVGNVGLAYTLLIILLSNLVTMPTAMAVAEIATNQKVEGGGAYYMISRSFGLNIGAAIGIALFLSQAISIAFYIIAFTYSFEPIAGLIEEQWGYYPNRQEVGLTTMTLLLLLMLTKGANVGVKALYLVVAIIAVSLVLFFAGGTYSEPSTDFFATAANSDDFFKVFTIIFPAFTGIAAGLGLSGDLKNPKVSIPKGTLWATIVGVVIYVAVSFKLFFSASLGDLANTDILIMEKISIWGPIIPIGLGAAAISSALGSIMIAPRTLQALGADKVFPSKLSLLIAKGRKRDNEPIYSVLITGAIGYLFIAGGDIDFVAEIISMFFMVTYGAICSISFLEHLGGNPAYRPTFKSKWYFSLLGAVLCFYLMFKMNFTYALASILVMLAIYFIVKRVNKGGNDLAELIKGFVFQLNRELQIFLQKRDSPLKEDQWRPFILSISDDTFKRTSALQFVTWLSHKYGFGTYLHYINGFLTKDSFENAKNEKDKLFKVGQDLQSKAYIDTIISPSFTSALAQSIQISAVSGKSNNLILLEYNSDDSNALELYLENYNLLQSTGFDICFLKSSMRGFGTQSEVHVWIDENDYVNSNLMILLAYILLGHKSWKNAAIKVFNVYAEGTLEERKNALEELITTGRLPISSQNISYIQRKESGNIKKHISKRSSQADITIIGFSREEITAQGKETFMNYADLGNVLFVDAYEFKEIK